VYEQVPHLLLITYQCSSSFLMGASSVSSTEETGILSWSLLRWLLQHWSESSCWVFFTAQKQLKVHITLRIMWKN